MIQPKLSHPGVYVAEVPSEPGSIPDIPTSITAFVGRTRMGPTDAPVSINSFGDFEAQFGGLWSLSPLSYSVKQFFDNGGSQACIARICATRAAVDALGDAVGYDPDYGKINPGDDDRQVHPPVPYVDVLGLDRVAPTSGATDDGRGRINIGPSPADQAFDPAKPDQPPTDGFQLATANPGAWGNGIRVELDREGITASIEARFGVEAGSMANLTVHHDGDSERHANVSFDPNAGAQRIDRVLERSRLVRYDLTTQTTQTLGALIAGSEPSETPLARIIALHQTTYRREAKTQDEYQALLPEARGGDDGYLLGDAGLFTGDQSGQQGLYQLDKIDIFNLLVIPRDTLDGDDLPLDYPAVFNYVADRRAFWILEIPPTRLPRWDGMILRGEPGLASAIDEAFDNPGDLGRSAAVYYPEVIFPDPLNGLKPTQFGPAGAVAGIFARTDAARGVWSAAAGHEATVTGLVGLTAQLDDAQHGLANMQGINCLRAFPSMGAALWGTRTLRGAEAMGDAFKYVPVRRLSLYIYESMRRGLQWAIFEPNDEALWSSIRARTEAFLLDLMRQGALQGTSAKQAFYVRCGLGQTMTAQDIVDGICNVQVGFAPIEPADFITLYFEQMTADSQG